MFDERYEKRRDPRIPNTDIGKNDEGVYEYTEPAEHGLMPYSLVFVGKFMTGFLLIVLFPFLIIDFSNWIGGYLKIAATYALLFAAGRLFKLNYLSDKYYK